MNLKEWYRNNWEDNLTGRYITLDHISSLLKKYKNDFEISVAGFSENGNEIPLIKIGDGSKIILAWSQMHGNESTTTKAIFDFLKFIALGNLFPEKIDVFLKEYSFYILPILNPDGADKYTRENANAEDLNRDAQVLKQKESIVLHKLFKDLKPTLCLNLHDQRSIYGFKGGNPAVVSFLSPAADKDRKTTSSRIIAMQHIVKMNNLLQNYIPGRVGRYDDSFNHDCVGDSFQKEGVTTILFEAGHTLQDYGREKTREYIFYAFLSLFDFNDENTNKINYHEYYDMPENVKNYNDIIIRNVKSEVSKYNISVAIQYSEILYNKEIVFQPVISALGNLQNQYGHQEIDMKGQPLFINSSQEIKIDTIISQLTDKNNKNVISFR